MIGRPFRSAAECGTCHLCGHSSIIHPLTWDEQKLYALENMMTTDVCIRPVTWT